MNEQIIASIFLALIQAATEFLPISSSGHLALFSNLLGEPNLSFMIALHTASLIAVIIFTRKEIVKLSKFKKEDRKYLLYLLIGILPAGIVGLLIRDLVENMARSYFFLGLGFLFSGAILLQTYGKKGKEKFDNKSALFVGMMQIFALIPGISRSGTTISTARILGIEKERAFNFSFLMFIPLALGATILEFKHFTLNSFYIIPFLVCFVASLIFLSVLKKIIIKDKFWMFSFYCFLMGIISLILHFN